MPRKSSSYNKAKSSLLQAKKSCIADKKGSKMGGMRNATSSQPVAQKAQENAAVKCPNCGHLKSINQGFYPAIFKYHQGQRNDLREPGIYGGGFGFGGVCPGGDSFQGTLCNLLGDCVQVNTEDGRAIVGTLADIGCGFISVAAGNCLAYIRIEDITSIIPIN